MGVESEAKETVQLLAEKVFPFQDLCHDIITSSPNDKYCVVNVFRNLCSSKTLCIRIRSW